MIVEDTPAYKDLVNQSDVIEFQGDRELALKNSLRTYKHEVLKEMRDKGELDTHIYDKVQRDMAAIKKSDVYPK